MYCRVPMKSEPGFSLVELLIALVIGSVVAASATGLLLRGFRSFREQTDRATLDAGVRQSAALFQAEFRGLDTRDSVRPDLISGQSTSIIYKPMRTLRFLCRSADTAKSVVTTWPRFLGSRDVRPDLDSVLLLVIAVDGEYWIGGDLVQVSPGACPGRAPGVALKLNGVTAEQLVALLPGAAVLGGEVSEIKSYSDSRGTWWLGMRRYQKAAGRWPAIQPVLGPLAPEGLVISYLDAAGGLVTDHTDVARIRVRITHELADPFARRRDRESVVDVALRGRGFTR